MQFKEGDRPKLYLPNCVDDKPFVGGCWEILKVNIRRCKCPTCQHNWTAGRKMPMPADYVLDISPGVDDGPILLVYEWQLIKPLEETNEEEEDEEANA